MKKTCGDLQDRISCSHFKNWSTYLLNPVTMDIRTKSGIIFFSPTSNESRFQARIIEF